MGQVPTRLEEGERGMTSACFAGPAGGGPLGGLEEWHLEVEAVAPDAGHTQGDRGDEARGAGPFGEGADAAGPALHHAVHALKAVGAAA